MIPAVARFPLVELIGDMISRNEPFLNDNLT